MKILEDGRIQCRVKITGSYKSKKFVFIDKIDEDGSQFYQPPNSECNTSPEYEPSRYWWEEGNMACDCNRSRFIGKDMCCGDTICIDRIEAIEKETKLFNLKPLILNESISVIM